MIRSWSLTGYGKICAGTNPEQRDILNKSLNETLSRTVMTSVTTLLALLAIVVFGGAVLRDFALAMMWA